MPRPVEAAPDATSPAGAAAPVGPPRAPAPPDPAGEPAHPAPVIESPEDPSSRRPRREQPQPSGSGARAPLESRAERPQRPEAVEPALPQRSKPDEPATPGPWGEPPRLPTSQEPAPSDPRAGRLRFPEPIALAPLNPGGEDAPARAHEPAPPDPNGEAPPPRAQAGEALGRIPRGGPAAHRRAEEFPLPIEPVLDELWDALSSTGAAVLQAPPGAGKTTRVPLFLMERGQPGRILLLEPRRVAARAAAERLAAAFGEAPGGAVGFRIRGERAPGRRIEVVTEGVLTRMIQSNPELPGVGCVIFDEFHERALQADLGLALTLEIREALRPDLRLLVMSATLDAAPVAGLLGDAPLITAQGRAWPVETRWLDRPWARPGGGPRFEAAAADLVRTALAETTGGVLVFLPGQAEIARVAVALAPHLGPEIALQPLHGGLPFARQRAALAPVAGRRKLVLATAIAETSLTIPDVSVVVDAGRARRARFDPASGMSRLVTERVTRAEAEQRRGRAGRTGPGRCFRLWTRGEDGALAAFPPPEIAAADLAGLALDLAIWGTADPSRMAFLTPPPAPALAEARGLLAALGALDAGGRITDHGRALARLPLHPRLGHMLIEAARRGAADLGADLAALLGARDPLRGHGGRAPADLGLRLKALRDLRAAEADHPVAVDRAALDAIRAEAGRLRSLSRHAGAGARSGASPEGAGSGLGGPPSLSGSAAGCGPSPGGGAGSPFSPGGAVSLAYPDRIGGRRVGSAPRFLLSGGKGAALPDADPLAQAPLIVAAELDGDPREAAIRLALPVSEAEIRDLHAARLTRGTICEWSRRDRAVRARDRVALGALALEDRPWTNAPPEALAAAMIAGVRDLGLEALPWTAPARRLRDRVEWLRAQDAPAPDHSASGGSPTGRDAAPPSEGLRPDRGVPGGSAPDLARRAAGQGAPGQALSGRGEAGRAMPDRFAFDAAGSGEGPGRADRGPASDPEESDLPDCSDAGLLDTLEDWLAPWLHGITRADQLGRVDLAAALLGRLSWPARRRLDALAPAEIVAPTGTRLPIDYGAPVPAVSVRLQEMFGLTRHPVVGPAALPLVLELLSPAGRPVQTTADLPGFWATSYADVRRDLRGRYPRHPWPEDPATAEPTRRVKPRGT